jgi:cation diffusion facilitator CzcD-associated flavoprotein CzcO
MKRICIVGFGAAGILLFLRLLEAKVPPKSIHIFDPYFDGGDLRRKWSQVRSNTTWRQIRDLFPDVELIEPWLSMDLDQPCSLEYAIRFLLHIVKPKLQTAELHSCFVDGVEQEKESKVWTVKVKDKTFSFDLLFLTTGSEPKSMDLPYPSIPLQIALDVERLKQVVSPDETIGLFGTAHSGAIIAENLVQCGAKVVNFYASPKPFYFAKDGDYDGVKQDAARIAEKILAGEYPDLELVPIQDVSKVIRKSKDIQKTIFAIGFEGRHTWGLNSYDGLSGKLSNVENAWGFGIAYPNKAEDGVHWDVSIPAFDKHIQKQIPNILSLFGIEA